MLRGLLHGAAVDGTQPAFRYRPLHEHPTYQGKALLQDLPKTWTDGLARLYNPPTDLATVVLLKMRQEKASGLVVLPHWPSAPWYGLLTSMATSLTVAEPTGDKDVRAMWSGRRSMNPRWRMVLATVNLPPVPPHLLGLPPSVRPTRLPLLFPRPWDPGE